MPQTVVKESRDVHTLSPPELYDALKDLRERKRVSKTTLENLRTWIKLSENYRSEPTEENIKQIISIQKETLTFLKKRGIELVSQYEKRQPIDVVSLPNTIPFKIQEDFSKYFHQEMYIEFCVIDPIHDVITEVLENDMQLIEKEVNALEKDMDGLNNKMITRVFEDSAIYEKKLLADAETKYKENYGKDADVYYLSSVIYCIKAGIPFEVVKEWYNLGADKMEKSAKNKIIDAAPSDYKAREGLKTIRAAKKKNRIVSENELQMLYDCAFAICGVELKKEDAAKYIKTDAKIHDQRIAPTYREIQRNKKMISDGEYLISTTKSDLSAINKYF